MLASSEAGSRRQNIENTCRLTGKIDETPDRPQAVRDLTAPTTPNVIAVSFGPLTYRLHTVFPNEQTA